MVARHRALRDRGVLVAVALLGAAVVALWLGNAEVKHPALDPSRPAALRVRVSCRGRFTRLATAELRPGLEEAPGHVGRSHARNHADNTGTVDVALPRPLPPGFQGELVVAAPGCLSERRRVGVEPREFTVTLTPTLDGVLGDAPGDPPPSPAFPPAAGEDALAALRQTGTFAAPGAQLWDGPMPTCVQCHVSTGAEHARVHGRPVSTAVRLSIEPLPPEERSACLACHAPGSATTLTDSTPPMGCTQCHVARVTSAETGMGLGPRTAASLAPRGAPQPFARGTRGTSASPAMTVEHAPDLADGTLCAACHAQRMPRAPATWADPTVEEHAAWQQADLRRKGTGCVACHFPPSADGALVQGAARAAWGVDRPDAPRRAHAREETEGASVRLAVVRGAEGAAQLRVTLEGVGHALPGPWPRRAWVLVLVDAAGAVLAEHAWRRDLLDDAGAPCALPWTAVAVGADSRLVPDDPRVLVLPPGAVAARLVERGTCGETRAERVLWERKLDG